MSKLLGAFLAAAVVSLASAASLSGPVAAHPSEPRVVQVAYGDVFTAAPDEQVVAQFTGRAGERVVLSSDDNEWDRNCETVALTHEGRTVEQDTNSMWTLRRTGGYELSFSQDCVQNHSGGDSLRTAQLRLRTVSVKPASLTGGRLDLGISRDSFSAASVRLDTSIPIQLKTIPGRGEWDSAMYATITVLHDRPGAGAAATSFYPKCDVKLIRVGQRACGLTFRRGESYLVLAAGDVAVSRYPVAHTTLNGAAVETRRTGAQWIDFSGRKGDLVYLDKANVTLRTLLNAEPFVQIRLPNGASVSPSLDAPDYREALMWELPRSGTYSLDVTRLRAAGPGRTAIRVRTARRVPMTIDMAVTVPVGGDRWTVALLPRELTNKAATYSVSDVTRPTPRGWRVVPLTGGDRHPKLTAVGTSSTYYHPGGLVIVPGKGAATGSMDVRIDIDTAE